MKQNILIAISLFFIYIAAFANNNNLEQNSKFITNQVLVIDLDDDPTSANTIYSGLISLGMNAGIKVMFPSNLSEYDAIFICLGHFMENHVLSQSEGQDLADYLNDGGNLYLEGGDTWFYDTPTPVHALFEIEGIDDGWQSIASLEGLPGTFTNGMFFDYDDEGFTSIDNLSPLGDAFTILRQNMVVIDLVIANEETNYHTIGASIKFGSLVDGDNTKVELLYEFLTFFGIEANPVGVSEISLKPIISQVYPNPSEGEINIEFHLNKTQNVSVNIFNIKGQLIYSVENRKYNVGDHYINFNSNESTIENGIYILKISTENGVRSHKIIMQR